MEKLKPCPFCGEVPEIETENENIGLPTYGVYCLNLHCPMDDVWVCGCPTKDKAVELWNTRRG